MRVLDARGRRIRPALVALGDDARRGGALVAAPAAAQDAHYWSQQYGTRSELLSGAVVGSPQDLSTTFYNPGGPGPEPFEGIRYTEPGPADLEPVIIAIDDPMRVSRSPQQ